MNYILLFVALQGNLPPANLGTYPSEASCQSAIRAIYENKMTPKGVAITPQMTDTIKQVVDLQMQYQREYRCQAQ